MSNNYSLTRMPIWPETSTITDPHPQSCEVARRNRQFHCRPQRSSIEERLSRQAKPYDWSGYSRICKCMCPIRQQSTATTSVVSNLRRTPSSTPESSTLRCTTILSASVSFRAEVELVYVSTDRQVAKIFTKPLALTSCDNSRVRLGCDNSTC